MGLDQSGAHWRSIATIPLLDADRTLNPQYAFGDPGVINEDQMSWLSSFLSFNHDSSTAHLSMWRIRRHP
jgi:hypothetical protein